MVQRGMSREAWPVMLTPFDDDRRIDWSAVDCLTDWYIASGMSGLFAVCQSSEMFDLTDDERLALAARVVQGAGGRVPVVATGTFGGPARDQAAFVRKMADVGVEAVVCLVNQFAAKDESDDRWKSNMETLLKETGDLRLGLYECPKPYHRLMSADLLAWAASTGRFVFMKETSSRLERIKEKIAATRGSPLRFLNANTRTLLASLRAGADGFCGTAANFYPDLMAWLCRHFDDQPELAERLQRFLTIAQPLLKVNYPASAKLYLTMNGLKIGGACRVRESQFSEEETAGLTALCEEAEQWRALLRLPAGAASEAAASRFHRTTVSA